MPRTPTIPRLVNRGFCNQVQPNKHLLILPNDDPHVPMPNSDFVTTSHKVVSTT